MKPATLILLCIPAALTLSCGDGSDGQILASGTIEGTDTRVGPQVAGRIRAVMADEGDAVQAGDTLVVIDDQDYTLQWQQARAAAEAAAAAYRLALEGFRKEDVVQAEAALSAAKADFERMTTLLAAQTVTQKQYDDARTRFVTAEQTYAKLVKGLRQPELDAARAQRDQAEALAALARKRVADCIVVAPAGGTITVRGIEPGEVVSPGQNLMTITRLDPVDLVIYVAEPDLAGIRLGQSAEVGVDGTGDRRFAGTIVYTSPVAEFTPKNVQTREERTKLVFAVKISIPNPEGILKPGMPADAWIVPAEGTKD
jgi:HlyD family secretion protein